MITVKELLNREKECQLYEKEINGFQFWQYERFYIFSCLQSTETPNAYTQNLPSLNNTLKYYIKNSRRLNVKNNVDICFFPHPRRVFNGIAYESIYTDGIAEKFPNSVSVERFYEMQHLEPIQSSNVLYLDRTIIEAKILFLLTKKCLKKQVKKLKTQIRAELQNALQGIATQDQIEKITLHTLQDYYLYQYYHKYYYRLLLKLKPKLIVEVVSYNIHCMVVNEVCKDLGITTIELQHGYIEPNHLAYNYAPNTTIRQFPDKIYLFGDFYKKNAQYPISQDNLVVVGFPYFERELEKHQVIKKEDYQCTIVFLSQGTPNSIAMLATELKKILCDKKIRILYKLHPSEYHNWKQLHPELDGSGIEVIGLDGPTLYECLAISDIQIGVRSTSILEGLGFGLRTFIYNQKEGGCMRELVDRGIAESVSTAQELAEKLDEHPIPKYEIKYFWHGNAMNDLEQALKAELGV